MRDSEVIIQNSMALAFKYIAVWGLNVVLVVFLPRYLGDTGLGQITFAIHFATMFAALVIFGMSKFLIKEIARDGSKLSAYLGSALVVRVVLSMVVLGMIALAVNLLDYSSQAKLVVYIAGLTMVATCFNTAMVSVMQGAERMRWQSVTEIVAKLAAVGVGVSLLVLGYGVVAYALVLLGSMVLGFLLNAGYVLKKFRVRFDFSLATSKLLVIGGFPFLLMGLFQSMYSQADVVMLRMLTTEEGVGWYGAALQLYTSLVFIPLVIVTAVLPSLARNYSLDLDRMKVIARKSISIVVLGTLPVAAGVGLLSDRIIGLLRYPDAFANSVPLLAILVVGLPITSLLMIIAGVVIAADKQSKWALATLATLGLNVGLNLVMIPFFQDAYGNGGIGAAATTVISESFMIAIGIRLMPRGILDVSVLKATLKSIAAAAAMAAVVWLAMTGGVGTAFLVAIGAVVYLTLSLGMRSIDLADIALLRSVLLGARGRADA